jgi:hypothetical protein
VILTGLFSLRSYIPPIFNMSHPLSGAQLECVKRPRSETSHPDGVFARWRFADMPKPTKHFVREVRRVRHLSAWITVQGGTTSECQVMDISSNGAKVVAAMSPTLPERFQLAFSKGGETRSCEVIWRHGKLLGVRFAQ